MWWCNVVPSVCNTDVMLMWWCNVVPPVCNTDAMLTVDHLEFHTIFDVNINVKF